MLHTIIQSRETELVFPAYGEFDGVERLKKKDDKGEPELLLA